MKRYYIFLLALALVSIFSTVAYYHLQRQSTADSQTSTDISSLQSAVATYATDNSYLPDSLQDQRLTIQPELKNRLTQYEYRKQDGNSYQICAQFKTDTSKRVRGNSSDSMLYHHAGKQCFTRTISDLAETEGYEISQTETICGNTLKKAHHAQGRVELMDHNTNHMVIALIESGVTRHFYWQDIQPVTYDLHCDRIDFMNIQLGQEISIISTYRNSGDELVIQVRN